MNELFKEIITAAMKQADMITEPKDKAKVYTDIANAIALSGLINQPTTTAKSSKAKKEEAVSKNEAPTSKPEETKKETPESKDEPAQENSAEEQDAPFSPDIEGEEEWTDEKIEQFKNELETVKAFEEKYGKDAVNSSIEMFSEGLYKTVDAINPLNIVGFVAYLKSLEEDLAQ